MKYVSIFFTLLFVSVSAFSQISTPKIGLEAGGSLKKTERISGFDSPAYSNYIGFYTQVSLKNRLSVKFGAGLNQTFVNRDEILFIYDFPVQSTVLNVPAIKTQLYNLSVNAELRYNLLKNSPSWGNLYAVLPVTFESPNIANWINLSPELKIIPGLVYRYEFNKHWGIEANAGLGWGKYLNYKGFYNRLSTFEYTTSLRMGYTF